MDQQLQTLISAQQRVNTILQRTEMPREFLLALQEERTATQALVNAMHDNSTGYRNGGFNRGGRGLLGTIGRAAEWGAGFGIGEDLINRLL